MTLQPSIPPAVPGLVHWPSYAAQFGLLSLRYLQRTCRKYAAAARNYTQCYAHNHNLCQLSAWQYWYNQLRSQLSCVQLSTKIFTKINFCMVKVIYSCIKFHLMLKHTLGSLLLAEALRYVWLYLYLFLNFHGVKLAR